MYISGLGHVKLILYLASVYARSICPEVFCEIGVLKNFAKLTGKHLCQSLFFDKTASLSLQLYLKKETLAQVCFCEFCEIFKNTFFIEHLCWYASFFSQQIYTCF